MFRRTFHSRSLPIEITQKQAAKMKTNVVNSSAPFRLSIVKMLFL